MSLGRTVEWRKYHNRYLYEDSSIFKWCFDLFNNHCCWIVVKLINQRISKTDGPLWASEYPAVCRAQTACCFVICKGSSIKWWLFHMRGILALSYLFIYNTSDHVCMFAVNCSVKVYSSTHSSTWHWSTLPFGRLVSGEIALSSHWKKRPL